ncbi:hypothetical protein ACVRZR_03665 [Streptococcus entericus]|uniref:hypothetical protein n=1 Tax=Streptococcus entericus TaxID=155680 RepID=UPI00036AD495|nr:hypothetical protein [Streptococcus entericus]
MAKSDDDLGLVALLGIGALAIGAIGLSLKHDRDLAEERARRRAMPINWPDGLSQEVFETICRKAAKSIRRLKITSIDGLDVSCEVKTSSGISTWSFSADFYDYGNLSGRWFKSHIENSDSTIPGVFLNKVSEGIKDILYQFKAFSPLSSEEILRSNVDYIDNLFSNAGFTNVSRVPCEKRIWSMFTAKGTVCFIKVDGYSNFSKNQLFESDCLVEIGYFYK